MSTEVWTSLEDYRDHLVVELWKVFHAMSTKRDGDDIELEDLELWTQITKHSAVQKRLQE